MVLILLLAATLPAAAQGRAPGSPASHGLAFGTRVAASSSWLFHEGDNPAYASRDMDDRGWKQVNISGGLASYGLSPYPTCWYRLHAQVHPDARHVSLALEKVSGSYEVFVNGVRIGGHGPMPARGHDFAAPVAVYPIADDQIVRSKGALVIALRFSVPAPGWLAHVASDPLNAESAIFLDTPQAIEHETSYAFAHAEIVNINTACLYLLSALFVFGLFLALRTQKEYLALGISATSACVYTALQVWIRYRYADHSPIGYLLTMMVWASMSVANLEFVRLLVHQRRGTLLKVIECATFVDVLVDQLYLLGSPWTTVALIAHLVMFIAGDAFVLVTLLRGRRRGSIDARLILPAWLATMIVDAYTLLGIGLRLAHLPHILPDLPDLPLGSYSISILDMINLIYVAALIMMVLLRTIRIARDRAAAASEIAAAQTVQQVLLARVSEPTPGFHIETAYHPASEVGGDFFFVSPGSEGSLIAVVGDVSGKGMLAAMRVSMILGVLRREDSRQPASILRSLNEVLLTQGEMGFTTACCVRLDRDGRYRIANAGHISPYVAGGPATFELETPGALPLGMAGDQHYETVDGTLAPGERLVLMSDGVVEARSATGELYGFDRMVELCARPAQEIADRARRFGQEDDITVLTIACGELPEQPGFTPTLAPGRAAGLAHSAASAAASSG